MSISFQTTKELTSKNTMVHVLSFAVFSVALVTVLSDVAVRGLPGSECSSNKQCTAANSFCDIDKPCYLGVCECETGFTLYHNASAEIGECIEDKKLGGTCGWLRGGCVGNLECELGTSPTPYSTGTCKCPYGTTADGDSWCVGSKTLGELCGETTSPFDFSHWACQAYSDYYKDDPHLSASYYYLSEMCLYNSTAAEYRCECHSPYYKLNAAGTACERNVVGNGQDCSAAVCDPDVSGLYCGTSNVCQCQTTLTLRTYPGKDGAQMEACAHANAVFEVQSGYECDESNADPAKHMYCEWPLLCGSCPEDVAYGVDLCMSGATELTQNLAVLAFSIFLTKYI